jgi:hypothetical protein
MKTYLIDTDIFIDFFKKNVHAEKLLEELSQNEILAVSILTISELRAGWTEEQAAFYLPRLYAITKVLHLTEEIAELSGKFRFEYKKKGKTLATIDTLIAATAIINDCFLITRNVKDYPMPEIELYKKMYK